MSDHSFELTTEILLDAYRNGVFPMADSKEDLELYWYKPEQRGIIPLDQFHLSKRLARTIFADQYKVKSDTDFLAVIDGCANPAKGREETWINPVIRSLFFDLFHQKHAHTIEVWEDNQLVGGLYGLAIGRAFFGESMFSCRRDVSKIALVYLVASLRLGGFELLDTQFMTGHLMQFGGMEITEFEYDERLKNAIQGSAQWSSQLDKNTIFQEIRLLRQRSSNEQ